MESLTEFEAMQIVVSCESCNDNEQNFIQKYFILNSESMYTELQILLTGDLSFLNQSVFKVNP
jgi:hypothetical protein